MIGSGLFAHSAWCRRGSAARRAPTAGSRAIGVCAYTDVPDAPECWFRGRRRSAGEEFVQLLVALADPFLHAAGQEGVATCERVHQ